VAQVLLGLGGNVGDPAGTIDAALARLDERGLRIVARSALYRTPPWGPVAQPDFVNLCARAETRLSPREVLAVTRATEAELGRERSQRWGPRTIDIDILAYDDLRVAEPDLEIPHPRLTERAFVLVPLRDVAPDWIIEGRSIRDWAATIDAGGIERLPGAV
jgi:2-amino-4-hydroxy-6-hydroxymethyldihydropteridine diphosphokinase